MTRIGFIGNHSLSGRESAQLCSQAGARISGVFFPSTRPLPEKTKTSLIVFDDPHELIRQSDLLICNEPVEEATERMVVDALKAARHLLIPKPVFLNPERVTYLFKLAEEASVVLRFRQYMRFHPVSRDVQKHLSKPEYIEVKRSLPLNGNGTDINGEMTRTLADCIDASLISNSANLKKHKILYLPAESAKPDMIHTHLELDNACVINIQLSRLSGEDLFEAIYYQNGCEIRADYHLHQVKVSRSGGTCPESHRIKPSLSSGPFLEEIVHFIGLVRQDRLQHAPGKNLAISFDIANSTWQQLHSSAQ